MFESLYVLMGGKIEKPVQTYIIQGESMDHLCSCVAVCAYARARACVCVYIGTVCNLCFQHLWNKSTWFGITVLRFASGLTASQSSHVSAQFLF